MTKTLNQIFFFAPPKSEKKFQQHWESEYFFRKKHNPPWKSNGSSLIVMAYDRKLSYISTGGVSGWGRWLLITSDIKHLKCNKVSIHLPGLCQSFHYNYYNSLNVQILTLCECYWDVPLPNFYFCYFMYF